MTTILKRHELKAEHENNCNCKPNVSLIFFSWYSSKKKNTAHSIEFIPVEKRTRNKQLGT